MAKKGKQMSLEKYLMKNGKSAKEALAHKTKDKASLGEKSEAKARKIKAPEGKGDTKNLPSEAGEVKLESEHDGDFKQEHAKLDAIRKAGKAKIRPYMTGC